MEAKGKARDTRGRQGETKRKTWGNLKRQGQAIKGKQRGNHEKPEGSQEGSTGELRRNKGDTGVLKGSQSGSKARTRKNNAKPSCGLGHATRNVVVVFFFLSPFLLLVCDRCLLACENLGHRAIGRPI